MKMLMLYLSWALAGLIPANAVAPPKFKGEVNVSHDGFCGGEDGYTCMDSIFGNCCSPHGYCGASVDYCGAGCQENFGTCSDTEGTPSIDGTCGGTYGYTCEDSSFGECCSRHGYCGSSNAYCGAGCDSDHGTCKEPVSDNGSCGGEDGYVCAGSVFGDCCSATGWCGSSLSYCGDGCQSEFGECGASHTKSASVVVSPTAHSTSSYSHSPTASCAATGTHSYDCPSNTTQETCVRCEGQPGDDEWCGYDINTNYYEFVPKTCRTVEYTLRVTNTTIAPDGIERIALLINDQMPGPTIEANWGDTVKVTIINEMQNNGTSFHFHGIRQNFTNQHDGVPSITQCPVAPGEQMTYTFVASQYGSSWYHSHFAIQTWVGVFGGLVIHGPHSAEFDVDLGPIFLQDWSHVTVDSLFDDSQDASTPGPQVMDNGLINGMNTWGADGGANQTGARYELEFEPGKKYLMRLVNAAIQSTYKFYIDNHMLTVIGSDFVPINPYDTNIVNINIGQRYDIIVEANQPADDYWMRSDNQQTCTATIQSLDIKAIVHYAGGPGGIPNSLPYNYTTNCIDEDLSNLVPVLELNAAPANTTLQKTVTIAANEANLFRWFLSGTTFLSLWGDPTLLSVYNEETVPTHSGDLIIEIPNPHEWVYLVIDSPIPLPHPIHLHGHDFFILDSGPGQFDMNKELNFVNPPRRDTALMQGAGYIVVAFEADNPGVWLMHCHVGWHSSMGFALQIFERGDEIRDSIDAPDMLVDTCSSWNTYAEANGIGIIDSGI